MSEGVQHGRYVVLSTVPDPDSARSLARRLVQSRQAACVNVLPGVESVYRWQGRVQCDGELLLLIKTNAQRLPELIRALQRWHPYECPEVVAVPIVDGAEDYLRWLDHALEQPARSD